jgi:hypothetical protein
VVKAGLKVPGDDECLVRLSLKAERAAATTAAVRRPPAVTGRLGATNPPNCRRNERG